MMKYALQFACLGIFLIASSRVYPADLTVQVAGVRSADGVILLSLFDRSDRFLKQGRDLGIAATPGAVTAVFRDVDPGTYAIAVHHDEDGDGVMARSLFGLPREGYGFSNDAEARFGPPRFAASAFAIGAEGGVHRIDLVYRR